MGENTKIEWCDSTWNPWIGCTKVSAGCAHCYAETLDKRALWDNQIHWGPTAPRRKTSEANWKKPLAWNKVGWLECNSCGWRGPYTKAISAPAFLCPDCEGEIHTTRQRVFCGSLCDIFERNDQLIDWRWQLMDLIDLTPNIDWLLLTKRIENVLDMVPWWWHKKRGQNDMLIVDDYSLWPKNVRLGVSVEDQKTADERIPKLIKIPVPNFLSIEPLLGPIDLDDIGLSGDEPYCGAVLYPPEPKIHWVIVGGESGPKARPCHPDWVRNLRDQCLDADVAFFMKQWGEWAPDCLCLRKTPCNTIPRPFPGKGGVMFRCGKKASGRLLDNREWSQFPE